MAQQADLNWDDLRYFLHAAQTRTLAGSARKLRVRHTTVGRRLSSLERSLEAPLVLRSSEGLQLTRLGQTLVPLVEEVERAIAALRQEAESQKARVRLAVPSGFTTLFTDGLAELRQRCPGLALELLSGSRPVDLRKGEADLAIRHGPIDDQELVARKLGTAGWSLYAAEAYVARRSVPTDAHELTGHEIIGYDASLSQLPAAQWVEAQAEHATIVMRSREMTDMLAATVSGVALALLPCLLGDAEPRLRRLTTEVLATRDLSLLYRRDARASESVRAVKGYVMEIMRRNAQRIAGGR